MTTTTRQEFSDYCAQRDAQNTIELNIKKHCLTLCDYLRENYIQYSIKSHEKSINLMKKSINLMKKSINLMKKSIKSHEKSISHIDPSDEISIYYHKTCIEALKKCIEVHKDRIEVHKERIEALKNGECDYDFKVDSSGRKYHKIYMFINDERDSIHAIVDKKTGEVYKPASNKAPAKGVRFNLNIIESRKECFRRADWAGSYLYLR